MWYLLPNTGAKPIIIDLNDIIKFRMFLHLARVEGTDSIKLTAGDMPNQYIVTVIPHIDDKESLLWPDNPQSSFSHDAVDKDNENLKYRDIGNAEF